MLPLNLLFTFLTAEKVSLTLISLVARTGQQASYAHVFTHLLGWDKVGKTFFSCLFFSLSRSHIDKKSVLFSLMPCLNFRPKLNLYGF